MYNDDEIEELGANDESEEDDETEVDDETEDENDVGVNGDSTGVAVTAENTQDKTATEESSPVAFSDWTQSFRFDRSFTAKLILSDDKVKEYYADLSTALLSYQKMRSRTGWNGVTFTAGRARIADMAIVGKTLCLYLALDPATLTEGKYRAKDVADVKKHEKTPAMLKIRSDGGKRYAIRLIDEVAEKNGLAKNEGEVEPIKATHFRTDSFNNLITRGLIRVLKTKRKDGGDEGEETTGTPETVTVMPIPEKPVVRDIPSGAYADTVESADSLLSRHGIYNEILTALSDGEGKTRFTERLMLRSVDEIWVRAVEDCLNSMDELIRNPNHFIAETEEVLPIELTKKVTGRSIIHLSRHADYLAENRDGEVMPTKLLNVFRDDSLLTYENKFLNTLINRLFLFVSKRYQVAKEYGADEKTESFEFENSFFHGEGKGRIHITIEYSEHNLNKDVKNALTGTGLWARVERLNDIVTAYVNSSFAKQMDRNFVRPPIMRTNAIVKNKYFRECLALWEFIESYDDAGYGITVEEKQREISSAYIKEMYENASMQYLLFRHHMEDGFEEDAESVTTTVKPNYNVEVASESEPYTETFTEEEPVPNDEEDEFAFALRVALMTDAVLENSTATGDEEGDVEEKDRWSRSFYARLRLATDETKEIYAEVSNLLLHYKGVNMRESRQWASFRKGRQNLARITVSEKTLRLYLALNPAEIAEKYNIEDNSDRARFEETPSCLRVRSNRSRKYAGDLVAMLAEKYGLVETDKPSAEVKADDYPTETVEEMIEKGWITYTGKGVPGGLPSIGTTKKEETVKNAELVGDLSVSESGFVPDDVKADASTSGAERTVTEQGKELAKIVDSIVRPTGNYSKPTEYGLDDTSGFIQDAESEEHKSDKKDSKKK